MKIIQSFAHFDNYFGNELLQGTEKYLRFYTFLYSYLTLKKYYDSVTMYCNQKAYDLYIKYIPYDDIIIKENTNDYMYWNAYKLDVIADQTENFIHVDSDVFIFDDLFISNFNEYDIIVQKIIPDNELFIQIKNYVSNNLYFYNNITNLYDNGCLACGVVGMSMNVKNEYLKDYNKIYNGFKNNEISLTGIEIFRAMILEELTLYLTSLRNNYKVYDLTTKNENFIHLGGESKFTKNNINYIKNEIKNNFSNDYHLINTYEEIISDIDIFCYAESAYEKCVFNKSYEYSKEFILV